MIIYNVQERFTALKNDADRIRVDRGLKPSETAKITINNREELAAFLDGLFQYVAPGEQPTRAIPDVPAARHVPDPENAPDYIPEFIKRDWARRASYSN